jgi:hypothetical protein
LATPAAAAAPSSHFVPGFVRRRPIRAVLLAAAVFAIPYSLARHQGDGSVPRIEPVSLPARTAPASLSNALPLGPVAIENVPGTGSSAPWHPPIGMDRVNEALDQLTMDFTSGTQPAASPQTSHPQPAPTAQTPEQPSGFQAGTHVTSADTAAEVQPAPAQGPREAPVDAPAAAVPPAPVTAPAPVAAPADAPDAVPAKPRVVKARPLDTIDQYLWSVYQRSTTKQDSSGDFTWKDEAAAARLGLVTKQYVIGGMDPDFRELLYNLGQAMDAAGLNWTILSGFRDDYRQGLASGYKAHVGNSFHGGSRATGGYGHGCAADIEASDGEGNNAVWKWVDQHGEKFGIFRPMKAIDPAHIQPSGGWHDIAFNLRDKRITSENGFLPASTDHAGEKITPLVDTRSGVSEAQYDCVRSHHHGDFRLAGLSHHQRIPMGGHVHRAALFHPGRMMHRFGRRRMVVETSSPPRRADSETVETVETVRVADQAGAETRSGPTTSHDDAGHVERHVKAEASAKNRRDSRRNDAAQSKVAARGGRPEKRPGKDASRDASVSDETAKRNARAHDVNAPRVVDRTRTDDRHQPKHAAADSGARQAKANQAKVKSRVADQGVSDKNDRKL